MWSERIARRLPGWMGSIRFRLTAIYSLFLFGLAAFVVAGIYLALANRLNDATGLQERHRPCAPGSCPTAP